MARVLRLIFILSLTLCKLHGQHCSSGRGMQVSASVLYWYTSETVDWGHVLTSSPNFVEDSYKTISFDWAPGFRIGLGYTSDQWDSQITYTTFQSQAVNEASGPITSGFLAARLSLLEPFGHGRMTDNLHYNMVDWDIGKSICVDRCVSWRPYVGLMGGCIKQKIKAHWTTPDFIVPGFLFTAVENVRNDFRGVGPKAGFEGRWLIAKSKNDLLSLIGNFGAAYMWGHWNLEDEYTDVLLTETSIPMNSRNFGALMLRASMGLGWDFNFGKCSRFSFKLSYEIQDWLNHFQVFTNDSGSDNFDLFLQGLTVDVGLKF